MAGADDAMASLESACACPKVDAVIAEAADAIAADESEWPWPKVLALISPAADAILADDRLSTPPVGASINSARATSPERLRS